MGMYTIAYAVPKGTRDRRVHKESTYRTHFYYTFHGFPGVEQIETPAWIYSTYDNEISHVMSPATYLAAAKAFQVEMGAEDSPLYTDDMTLWLQSNFHTDDLEIILVNEI